MLGRYIHIYEEPATTLPRTPEAEPVKLFFRFQPVEKRTPEAALVKLFFRFQPVEKGGEMWGPRELAGLTSMNVHAG